MSSSLGRIERFLASAEFDRGPWLAVLLGCGIAAWFALPQAWQWCGLLAGCIALAAAAALLLAADGAYPFVRLALVAGALALGAGCATVWTRSALVGTPGLDAPYVGTIAATVIAREDRPAKGGVRLVLALRDPFGGKRIVRVRLKAPDGAIGPAVVPGARIRAKVRLMPPAPAMLPGGHDFARAAWFDGIAGTGTALAAPVVIAAAPPPGAMSGSLARLRRTLSEHIATVLPGSAGGIAAALASGDRGGIAQADEDALRDAGLSHLLSVSGLHVSAVVGAAYVLGLRLLALWPWLALRARIPLLASAGAALAGVFYTLLTGAEVPTVRSMAGALLVLAAVALGREPLSLRLLAVAAAAVMLAWPEAVMGPSFQLSFGAVLAIVALHGTARVRAWSAPREEAWWRTGLRKVVLLVGTGVVVELALLPIGLFHFHRAGLYGALANVIAIPLTTFVIMPLEALALLLDGVGLTHPVWWLAGQALALLLALAHAVSRQPGAVTLMPAMGGLAYALFLGGGLWLALWQRPARRWALVPITAGLLWLMLLRPPDALVSADGRHVALPGLAPDALVVVHPTRSDFARATLSEMAGRTGQLVALDQWPGARCNDDFCVVTVRAGGEPSGAERRLLLSRGSDPVPARDVVAACDRVDVVISPRWLPAACRPALLRLDRAVLARTGGVALDLATGALAQVIDPADEHGWQPRPREDPKHWQSPPAPDRGGAPDRHGRLGVTGNPSTQR